MTKTLTSVAVWAVLGWLAGYWFDAAAGWAVFSLGLLIMTLVSGVQISQIGSWVRNLDASPPVSVGPWNDILAPIYRRRKKDRNQIAELNRHVDAMTMAA